MWSALQPHSTPDPTRSVILIRPAHSVCLTCIAQRFYLTSPNTPNVRYTSRWCSQHPMSIIDITDNLEHRIKLHIPFSLARAHTATACENLSRQTHCWRRWPLQYLLGTDHCNFWLLEFGCADKWRAMSTMWSPFHTHHHKKHTLRPRRPLLNLGNR